MANTTNTSNNPQQFLDRDGLSILWGRITTEFAPRWKSYRPLLTNESFATNQTPLDETNAHQTHEDGLCIDFASAGVLTLEDGTVYGKGIRVKLPRVVAPTDSVADSGKDGIMSWEDKQKLDSLESTAENAVTIKGVKVGTNSDVEKRKLTLTADKFVNWDLRFNSTANELQVVDVNNKNTVLTKVNVKDFVADAIKEGFLAGASLVTSKPLENNQVKEGTYIKLTFKIKDGSNTENDVTDVYLDVNDLIDIYTAGKGISINNDLTNDTTNDTPRTTEISLKTASNTEIGGIKVKNDNTNLLDNTSTLKTTNQNGRYFGVEINKDDVGFVNVPIGELSAGSNVLGGTTTVNTNEGGEFTFVTGISKIEHTTNASGDVTGNTITLNTGKIEITKETSITINDSAVSGGTIAHNKGTFTTITGITNDKDDKTNGHKLTLTKTTYTLPDVPAIDATTDSTTTKQLVANYTDSVGDPASTSTILKDITAKKVVGDDGVESYVITKTYETIDVHVTPIDVSFINSLTLMTS